MAVLWQSGDGAWARARRSGLPTRRVPRARRRSGGAWRCALLLLGLVLVPIPGTAQNEASSAPVVREIRFERLPVFSDEDRARVPWLPLGLVNRLHIDTRPGVIRRELLVQEGDRLDLEDLEESERKLRGLRIFSRVDIRTESAPGDSVDVVIRTQELWSTAVDVGYERFEDQLLWNVRMRERNFLGTARSFDLERAEDVDRSSWTVGLYDPQLFGTIWNAGVRVRDADDGGSWAASLARPFFRIDGDWAWSASYRDARISPRYYVDDFRFVRPDGDFVDARTTLIRRIASGANGVWRARLGFVLRHQEMRAAEPLVVSDASGELPLLFEFPDTPGENRTWTSPTLGIGYQTRRFEKLRFVDAMGTVEDFAMGPEFVVDLGWANRAMGGTDSGLYVQAGLDWNQWLGRRWLHRFDSNVDGVLDADGSRDLRWITTSRHYRSLAEGVTFALGGQFAAASRIDRHRVFGLGLESGLRASRFRELSGDRLVRVNTELRGVYQEGIWDLVTPGVALFADVGTAWFEERIDFSPELLRGAIGFGLRLGFNRAANDVPIRVDLAWPILYPTDQTSPVISVGTGHVF